MSRRVPALCEGCGRFVRAGRTRCDRCSDADDAVAFGPCVDCGDSLDDHTHGNELGECRVCDCREHVVTVPHRRPGLREVTA